MPFSLCNAPTTFEPRVDTPLYDLKWSSCLCYLDDGVIFASTFVEHLERLRQVLDCFREAGLQLNLKKCSFGCREINVFGHIVSVQEDSASTFVGSSHVFPILPSHCSTFYEAILFSRGEFLRSVLLHY